MKKIAQRERKYEGRMWTLRSPVVCVDCAGNIKGATRRVYFSCMDSPGDEYEVWAVGSVGELRVPALERVEGTGSLCSRDRVLYILKACGYEVVE